MVIGKTYLNMPGYVIIKYFIGRYEPMEYRVKASGGGQDHFLYSFPPQHRKRQPGEVSPCYVFFASDDASYMTGQVLHPNGGTIVGG